MRKTKGSLVAIAAVAMSVAGVQAAAAQDLGGVWVGYYAYAGGAGKVDMQAHLSSEGSGVSGQMIEPRTFGDPGVLFLTSNLRGSSSGGSMRFTKTYDGTGGQSHSVAYEGAFDSAGQCIAGNWTLEGTSGTFRLCPVDR
jgi:hypothetical protein